MSTINIDLTGETLYTGDGTLNSDRVVDCGTHTLRFTRNGGVFFETATAPTGGDASFNIIGNGSSGGSIIETVKNGLGLNVRQSFGDKSQLMYGQVSIGNQLGTPYLLEVDGAGLGLRGVVATSSGTVAVQGSDSTNIGVFGVTQSGIGVLGQADTGQGGRFTSNGLASYHRGAVLIESGTSEAYNIGSLFSVNSTTKFSLPFPRMTETERLALTGLVQSAMVYQTDNIEGLYIYKSSGWTFVI